MLGCGDDRGGFGGGGGGRRMVNKGKDRQTRARRIADVWGERKAKVSLIGKQVLTYSCAQATRRRNWKAR